MARAKARTQNSRATCRLGDARTVVVVLDASEVTILVVGRLILGQKAKFFVFEALLVTAFDSCPMQSASGGADASTNLGSFFTEAISPRHREKVMTHAAIFHSLSKRAECFDIITGGQQSPCCNKCPCTQGSSSSRPKPKASHGTD